MKKVLAVILVAAAMMSFAGCGSKTEKVEDLAAVKEAGVMNVGITYFAPMNYMDENDELIGFETEFTKAVCEKLGVEANFIEINWDSKEIELNAKNIDCIWNGMTITDDRIENMSMSNPYMTNKQVVVAKAENATAYAEGVDGLAVVAEAGSAGETVANENAFFANANYTPVDSQAKALMEVAAGTADVAVLDYVASIGSIGEGTDYENLVVVETENFGEEEYGIGFRKGSDLTEAVNNAISELAADGTLKEIAEKYKLADVLSAK